MRTDTLTSKTVSDEDLDACMSQVGAILVVRLDRVVFPSYLCRLRERVLAKVHDLGLRGIALSCERVASIDARSVHALNRILNGAKLLGARVYIASLRPVVAATIVGLGEELSGALLVQNLDQALRAYSGGGVR